MKKLRWAFVVVALMVVGLSLGAAGQGVSQQQFDGLQQRVTALEQRVAVLERLIALVRPGGVPVGGGALPAQAVARAGGGYVGVGGGHWVKQVIDSGRMLLLEDGSLWDIAALDRIDTVLWLPMTEITVLENPTGLLPYKLVNTDDGEVAEARYIGTK